MEAPASTIPLEPATLFSSAWWLDAAAPGAWGEATVEESGRVVARLAYSERKAPLVGRVLGQPPLTPYLGPELSRTINSDDIETQNRVCQTLIGSLPTHARFQQNFHPAIANWMAFYWQGFQQHTRYTHRFEDVSSPDALWEAFSQRARYAIRRAEKTLTIDSDASAEDLYRLTSATYRHQGGRPGYSLALLQRVSAAATARGQGSLLVARDAQGVPHAGLFLVWDARCAYYLVGGSDPTHRASGAASLLIWEAIRRASRTSQSFDFEGSMQPGIAFFFRSFKPRQTPYFRVARSNAVATVVTLAYRQARRWRGAA